MESGPGPDQTHFVLAAEVTPEHKPRVKLKQNENPSRSRKTELGRPEKSEGSTDTKVSPGNALKSDIPRHILRTEDQTGFLQVIQSENSVSLSRTCPDDVSGCQSEKLGSTRLLPRDNLELSRAGPSDSLDLLPHRTLSRGPTGGHTLSRPGIGHLVENGTLQYGTRKRLVIGADTILREREVEKNAIYEKKSSTNLSPSRIPNFIYIRCPL